MITVIFGLSASGKTYLSKSMRGVIIHSDDYIAHGFERALYTMMDDIDAVIAMGKDVVIEGVQCARLLRKWQQKKHHIPNRVILCITDDSTRWERHADRGTRPNPGFDKMLMGIWNEWAITTGFKYETIRS